MPLYENAVIYKLKHNLDYDDLNIYIGSTTNFRGRKYEHKSNCNNEKSKKYNIPVYQFIRDNGGWEEWVMIQIEPYSCYSKKELETRERYHIDFFKPTLNKEIPTRTVKEWYNDNKEVIAKKCKKRHNDNREKNLEKQKKYREANKEKINEKLKEHRKANKEKINKKLKEHYHANKEKISEKRKEYYEKVKEQRKEKVICDHCGCEIRKTDLKKHQKTKKCLKSKENNI
jgi:hypothetical protein